MPSEALGPRLPPILLEVGVAAEEEAAAGGEVAASASRLHLMLGHRLVLVESSFADYKHHMAQNQLCLVVQNLACRFQECCILETLLSYELSKDNSEKH